jgi:hypothetical protein
MVVKYDTIKIIMTELVSLFYKILFNEVSNFKDTITYDSVIDILNNMVNSYDKILKHNIEQLINKHFVTDDKDCYLTIDFPLMKLLYNKIDNLNNNQVLTNTNMNIRFLDTIKIEFPTLNDFKDIIQPLHVIINNNSVDKEFLNRSTTQEYLLIEKHIMNIMSKYLDYLNHQLLMLILFKMSKIMMNSGDKLSTTNVSGNGNNNKVLGIVTVDKDITCDENYSYTYKWVYGIFDVSNPELEDIMKLHINHLSKKYNGSDTKIHYDYIYTSPSITKILNVTDTDTHE